MSDQAIIKAVLEIAEHADDYFRIHGEPTTQIGPSPSKKYVAIATLRNVRDRLRALANEAKP